jgi:hypothetical protein
LPAAFEAASLFALFIDAPNLNREVHQVVHFQPEVHADGESEKRLDCNLEVYELTGCELTHEEAVVDRVLNLAATN